MGYILHTSIHVYILQKMIEMQLPMYDYIHIYIYTHDAASQVPPLPPMGMGIQGLCSPHPLWVGGGG